MSEVLQMGKKWGQKCILGKMGFSDLDQPSGQFGHQGGGLVFVCVCVCVCVYVCVAPSNCSIGTWFQV